MSGEPADLAFVEFPEFLSAPVRQDVLESIASQAARFRETGVPGVRVLPSLSGAGRLVGERIRDLLPEACERLGLSPPSRPRIDLPVAAIEHGGKLEIAAMGNDRRAAGISYTLTLFDSPKRFTGGALTLENPDNRDVRIALPAANGRIVFCADCEDLEIGRVQSSSRDLRSCLFVIHGTIRPAA